LVCALMALSPLPLSSETPELERQRRGLTEIQQEVDALREDLVVRRQERSELLRELEQRERDIAALARAQHQLAVEIRALRESIERLQREHAAETKILAREQRAISELMRAVYATGPADRLRLLLDQDDAKRLSRLLAYYEYINRQRLARVARTRTQIARLARLTENRNEEVDRLEQLAAHQLETQRRLEEAQTRRTNLLAEIEQTIASGDDRVSALEADARELRALIARLEQQGQIVAEADVHQEPLSNRRGRLPWPVQGRLKTRFAAAKQAGALKWDGVVLASGEGAPVRAVHPGRVVYADWLRGFGLLLILDHGDGFMTLYGNNQTVLKEAGEWVIAGEPIALSGTTGGPWAEGLYFALRRNGTPLDPEDWCSDRGEFVH